MILQIENMIEGNLLQQVEEKMMSDHLLVTSPDSLMMALADQAGKVLALSLPLVVVSPEETFLDLESVKTKDEPLKSKQVVLPHLLI